MIPAGEARSEADGSEARDPVRSLHTEGGTVKRVAQQVGRAGRCWAQRPAQDFGLEGLGLVGQEARQPSILREPVKEVVWAANETLASGDISNTRANRSLPRRNTIRHYK